MLRLALLAAVTASVVSGRSEWFGLLVILFSIEVLVRQFAQLKSLLNEWESIVSRSRS